MPAKITDEILRPIIETAHVKGQTAQQIVEILWTNYHVRVAVVTIQRRRKAWGLLVQRTYTKEALDKAILDKYSNSYSQNRSLISLKNEDGLFISRSTLTRHEKALGIHRRLDDLDLGIVNYEEIIELINGLQAEFGHVLGIKSIKKKLAMEHDIQVHR